MNTSAKIAALLMAAHFCTSFVFNEFVMGYEIFPISSSSMLINSPMTFVYNRVTFFYGGQSCALLQCKDKNLLDSIIPHENHRTYISFATEYAKVVADLKTALPKIQAAVPLEAIEIDQVRLDGAKIDATLSLMSQGEVVQTTKVTAP